MQRLYAIWLMPSLLWLVAETGHTFSQGALSQCWQSIGWKTISGFCGLPVKYLSILIHCISWNLATSFFPTVEILFSATQAMVHAPQPIHVFKSMLIPHLIPGLS